MSASARKEESLATPSFDVNSFLRKTLSDFTAESQPIIRHAPESQLSQPQLPSVKTRQGRRKLNRNLADGNVMERHENRLPAEDPSEGSQLIPRSSDEPNFSNVHPVTVIDKSIPLQTSASSSSLNYGKLRTHKKQATPCPSRASLASASSLRPLCRICHLGGDTQGTGEDQLISPCRCSGTMQFVHTSCLVHWLEISTKKMCPTPHCELCGYMYKTHHCFRLQTPHLPRCSHQDKILHLVFVLVLLAMIGCAGLSVMYLKADKGYKLRTSLNHEDIIVIVCSVLFFCSFFVAVFTQYRAEASLCRLLFRCWLINEHWRIKNYDRKEDEEWKLAHQTII